MSTNKCFEILVVTYIPKGFFFRRNEKLILQSFFIISFTEVPKEVHDFWNLICR